DYYLVRCLENGDCPSGQICDKSGTWQQWQCKNDPCASVTCNNYCAGTTRYYSGQCSQSNGQCSYSQENCATQNYYDAYVNYCSGNELRKHRIYHQYSCSNGGCAELHGIYWTDDQLVQNCEFGCNDQTKQCNADPCTNVACNDYCDGATSYHSGQCVSGTCAFQIAENSTTCGYEEPEPTPEPTPEPPAEEPEEPTPTTEGILNPSLYIDGVKIFEYDGVLDTMVYVNDYSTVLNAYLEDCTPDENGVCKVPIEIKGDSDGIIKLKNLNILFEEKEQEEPIEEEPTTPEEPGEIEEPEEPIEEEPVTPEEPVEEEPVTPEEPIEEVPPQVNLVAKLWFKHCAKSTAPFGGGYAQGSAILFDADGDGGLEEHHMISVAMGFPEQTMQYRTPENYVIKKLKIGDNWRLAIGVDGYNYLYQYYEGGKCISVIEGDPENEVCVDSQNIKVSCIVEENIPVSEPEPVENEPIEEEIVEEETEEPVPEVPIIDTSKTSWDSQFQKKKSSTRPIGDGYAEGAEIELDSNGDGKTECYSMKSVALGFEEQVLPFTTTEGYTIKRLKIGDNWNNIAIQVGDQSYLFGLINC
ncbi:hypothetical protein KY325_01195, partial [Candidatus Woesearchaeota archaeon]|nr:hypothetical protein [Candidatus Woesearchaeota archaeon]